MSSVPFARPPVACTLPTLEAAKEQVEKWKAFEADYALGSTRTDSSLDIEYANVEDSVRRLRELVAVERDCCAFVEWSIDEERPNLHLVVTGNPFELSALNVG